MLKLSEDAEGHWQVELGLSGDELRRVREGEALYIEAEEGELVVCSGDDPGLETYCASRDSGEIFGLLVLDDGDLRALEDGRRYEREVTDLGAERDGRVVVVLASVEEAREKLAKSAEAGAKIKKRKKKRKPAPHESAADAESPKGAEPKRLRAPNELPGAGTPEGDQLRAVQLAFEVGDYVRVRRLARALESASDPEVRDAAIEIAGRTAIDPVQIVVIVACAAVLATIVFVWVF